MSLVLKICTLPAALLRPLLFIYSSCHRPSRLFQMKTFRLRKLRLGFHLKTLNGLIFRLLFGLSFSVSFSLFLFPFLVSFTLTRWPRGKTKTEPSTLAPADRRAPAPARYPAVPARAEPAATANNTRKIFIQQTFSIFNRLIRIIREFTSCPFPHIPTHLHNLIRTSTIFKTTHRTCTINIWSLII